MSQIRLIFFFFTTLLLLAVGFADTAELIMERVQWFFIITGMCSLALMVAEIISQ